jgi:uncharacterized membrane protein
LFPDGLLKFQMIVKNNSLALVPLLFAILALTLRLWHLDYLSIWLDEGYTAYDSTLPLNDLWTTTVIDKPPVYYHITSLFWSPGDGAFALRLPAALFGALTVLISWYLGKAAAGSRGAFLLALFVLLSRINIYYSQEARQYILLTAGWLIVVLSLFRLLDLSSLPKPPTRILVQLTIGIVIMLYAHPLAFYYLAAACIIYPLSLALSGPISKPSLSYPFLSFCLGFIAFLPWLRVLKQVTVDGRHSFNWLTQPSAFSALSQFVETVGGGWLTTVFSICGFVLCILRQRLSKGVFLIGLLLLPPFLIWLTGFVKPTFMDRTIMPGHFLALLGLVLLITNLQNRWIVIFVKSVIIASLSLSAYKYFTETKKEDWKGLANEWRLRAKKNDVMVFRNLGIYRVIHFYLGDDMPKSYAFGQEGVNCKGCNDRSTAVDAKEAWPTKCLESSCDALLLKRLPETPNVIWFVGRGSPPTGAEKSDIQINLLNLTGNKYIPGTTWHSYKVSMTPYRKQL